MSLSSPVEWHQRERESIPKWHNSCIAQTNLGIYVAARKLCECVYKSCCSSLIVSYVTTLSWRLSTNINDIVLLYSWILSSAAEHRRWNVREKSIQCEHLLIIVVARILVSRTFWVLVWIRSKRLPFGLSHFHHCDLNGIQSPNSWIRRIPFNRINKTKDAEWFVNKCTVCIVWNSKHSHCVVNSTVANWSEKPQIWHCYRSEKGKQIQLNWFKVIISFRLSLYV